MAWAVLGDVEFDLLTSPTGLESSQGYTYAEHERIGLKPRLQWVGDELRQIRLQLQFMTAYCDPEAELGKLQELAAAHQPKRLVLGTGEDWGYWVIKSVRETRTRTDGDGLIVAVDVELELIQAEAPAPAQPPARLYTRLSR